MRASAEQQHAVAPGFPQPGEWVAALLVPALHAVCMAAEHRAGGPGPGPGPEALWLPPWDLQAPDHAPALWAVDIGDPAPGAALSPRVAASRALQGGAALLASRAPWLAVRQHLRSLVEVHGPDGSGLLFRFHDPEVLHACLQAMSPVQRLALMGPVDAWCLPDLVARRRLVWRRGPQGVQLQWLDLPAPGCATG